MNAKKIIEVLNEKGVKFTVSTDIAYGRGINGIDYESYATYEERGDNLKTIIYRTFIPKDDYLLIIEDYVPPKIPWNRAAEKDPYTRGVYVGYDRITHITEMV